MFFKRNLWAAYYLIVVISLLALGLLTYSKHDSLHKEQSLSNASIAQLLSAAFKSTLSQNELLLDILGNSLLENQRYKNIEQTQKLLKQMLKGKPTLLGFGLFSPDGDFITTSDNFDTSVNFPNLMEQEESRNSFLRTLTSNKMELGRTYYFPPSKSWVIPLRKALRDGNGKVVAVITTGIKIENGSFLGNNNFSKNRQFALINDINQYRIYTAGKDSLDYSRLYSAPLKNEVLNDFNQILKDSYSTSLKEIRDNNKSVTINYRYPSELLQEVSDSVAVYDPQHQVWTILLESSTTLNKKLSNSVLQYFLMILVTNLIIFWLFKIIADSEKNTRKRLMFQANHDSLTGLLNRNFLEKEYEQSSNLMSSTLLFIDLDNFKAINDNFGHQIGDKLLQIVAERLSNFVENKERLIRFGGDEFLLFVDETHDEKEKAANIIAALSKHYLIEGKEFILGASIGISVPIGSQQSLATRLSQADLAMYAAKNRKNVFEYFSDELYQKSLRRMAVEQQLRTALPNNEIFFVYQPQMLANGSVHGVEALARWMNPTLGFVPPDEFIQVAEDIGMMPELGKMILQNTLLEVEKLQQKLSFEFQLGINISVKQLLDPEFLSDFKNNLAHCQINPKRLTLEVTETVFIEEIEVLLPLLEELKSTGVSISLDDFGTGYSSLSLLRNLPLSELKIDKSFVNHINEDEKDQGLAASIINIAKKIDANPLAEGVETEEQFNLLKKLGCEIFQGYYFSKPLTLQDLETFLQNMKAQ